MLVVVFDMMLNKINDRWNLLIWELGGIVLELWFGVIEEFILVLSYGGYLDYCWRVEEIVLFCWDKV